MMVFMTGPNYILKHVKHSHLKLNKKLKVKLNGQSKGYLREEKEIWVELGS